MVKKKSYNYQLKKGIHLHWNSDIQKWTFTIPSINEEQKEIHVIFDCAWITNPVSLGNVIDLHIDCKRDAFLFVGIREGILTHIDATTDEIRCKSVCFIDSKNHTKDLLNRINQTTLNSATYLERQDLLNILKATELLDENKDIPVGLITELESINQKALYSSTSQDK